MAAPCHGILQSIRAVGSLYPSDGCNGKVSSLHAAGSRAPESTSSRACNQIGNVGADSEYGVWIESSDEVVEENESTRPRPSVHVAVVNGVVIGRGAVGDV